MPQRTPWLKLSSTRLLILAPLLLYGWTVTNQFFADDYHHLSLMHDFREGRRPELALYRFLRGDTDNSALRAANIYPWWICDDVRYQHSRPLSEWWLYGQFRIFGDQPFGYHCVSLAMYIGGILLVARLFRLLIPDERTARWAAFIYAVAGAHALGVTFISMQCDLLGLLLVGTALCAATRFTLGRPAAHVYWLCIAGVCFALSLGAKESSLPAALLPALLGYAHREKPGVLRRGILATTSLTVIGLIWLASYATRGFGSNNAMMLDPMNATASYFAELPVRAAVLLSTWILPVNPFFFYLRPFGKPIIPIIAIVGVIAILPLAYLIRRVGRHAAMKTVWTLSFLPLLVCTVPDDRNLILPGIGFAFLAALWLTLPGKDSTPRLRKIPFFLFVIAQILTAIGTTIAVHYVQSTVSRNIAVAEKSFGRPATAGDCIFFLNIDTDAQALFNQEHFNLWRKKQGEEPNVRMAFLCDIRGPSVTRVDDHTIRLEAKTEPMLASFLGEMGRSRVRHRRVGDEFDAGPFRAKITRVQNNEVREVELKFEEPLDCDHYRFMWCTPAAEPAAIRPGKPS